MGIKAFSFARVGQFIRNLHSKVYRFSKYARN